MNVVETSHPWIGTFAGHLLKLETRMSAAQAVQSAVENIHRVGHLPPEVAARMVLADVSPASAPKARTDPSARYRQLFAER